jgi:hypothetical protein
MKKRSAEKQHDPKGDQKAEGIVPSQHNAATKTSALARLYLRELEKPEEERSVSRLADIMDQMTVGSAIQRVVMGEEGDSSDETARAEEEREQTVEGFRQGAQQQQLCYLAKHQMSSPQRVRAIRILLKKVGKRTALLSLGVLGATAMTSLPERTKKLESTELEYIISPMMACLGNYLPDELMYNEFIAQAFFSISDPDKTLVIQNEYEGETLYLKAVITFYYLDPSMPVNFYGNILLNGIIHGTVGISLVLGASMTAIIYLAPVVSSLHYTMWDTEWFNPGVFTPAFEFAVFRGSAGTSQNVKVVNTEPIWISPYKPEAVVPLAKPKPLIMATPIIPDKAVGPKKCLYYYEKSGTEHSPRWAAITYDLTTRISVDALTKKECKRAFYEHLLKIYGEHIEMREVSGHSEFEQLRHNKTMHSLNGNMHETASAELANILNMMSTGTAPDVVVEIEKSTLTLETYCEMVKALEMQEESYYLYYRHMAIILPLFKDYIYEGSVAQEVSELLVNKMLTVVLEDEDYVTDPYIEKDLKTEGRPAKPPAAKGEPAFMPGAKPKQRPREDIEWGPQNNEITVTPKTADIIQRRNNYIHMIDRLVKKYSNMDVETALWYLYSKSPLTTRKTVFYKSFVLNSTTSLLTRSVNAMLEGVAGIWICNEVCKKLDDPDMNVKDIESMFWHKLNFGHADLRKVREAASDHHNKLMHALFGNIEYVEMQARRRNKMMHAANGNTMKEIDATDGLLQILSKAGKRVMKGSELLRRLKMLRGNILYNFQDYTQALQMTSSVVDDTNQLIGNASVAIPLTCLQRRDYQENGSAFPTPITFGLGWQAIQSVPAKFLKQEMTTPASQLYQKAVVQNNMQFRADQILFSGYVLNELMPLLQIAPTYDYIGDQCNLKLCLLHQILSFGVDAKFVPVTYFNVHFPGDPNYTNSNISLPVTWGDLTGYECGGLAASQFPISGGTGDLFFHISTQTIPAAERQNALYFPLAMATSPQAGQLLACFLASWAEYPFAFPSYEQFCYSPGHTEDGICEFTHFGASVYIPGMTRVHVLLPRITPSPPPRDLPSANTNVIYQPKWGPTPTAGIPAGDDINICFINGVQGSSLTGYLLSWFSTAETCVDLTTIRDYWSYMMKIIAVTPSLERMEPLMDVMSNAGSEMRVRPATQATGGADLFAGSYSTYNGITSMLRTRHSLVAETFPYHPGNNVAWVHNSDQWAWNQVATGMYVPNEVPSSAEVLPEWVGRIETSTWSTLRSAQYYATMQVFYGYMGWSAEFWQEAMIQDINVLQPYRRLAKGLYNNLDMPSVYVGKSLVSTFIEKLFEGGTEYKLKTMSSDKSVLTFFDHFLANIDVYCSPRIEVGGQFAVGTIPAIFCDALMNVLLANCPKLYKMWPLPLGKTGVQGYLTDTCGEEIRTGAIVSGASTFGPFTDKITKNGNDTQDERFFIGDETRWNFRVAVTSSTYTLRHLAGQDPGVNYRPLFAYPNIPAQRHIEYFGTIIPPVQSFISTSVFAPIVAPYGLYILPFKTSVNVDEDRQAMARVGKLAFDTWQLMNNMANLDLIIGKDKPLTDAFDAYFTKPVEEGKDAAPVQIVVPPGAIGIAPTSASL